TMRGPNVFMKFSEVVRPSKKGDRTFCVSVLRGPVPFFRGRVRPISLEPIRECPEPRAAVGEVAVDVALGGPSQDQLAGAVGFVELAVLAAGLDEDAVGEDAEALVADVALLAGVQRVDQIAAPAGDPLPFALLVDGAILEVDLDRLASVVLQKQEPA